MKSIVSAIEKLETAIHSMRAWRKETMACQETKEACLECKEPTAEEMQSGGPQGTCHSETCQRTKEAAPGLASSSEAPWPAKRTESGKLWIQEEIGRHCRGMTCHAGVARCKGDGRQGQDQDNVARGTPKGQTFGKKCQLKPKSSKGINSQGLMKQLYLRSERPSGRIFRKTTGLDIVKQIARSLSGCRKSGNGHCGGVGPLQNRRRTRNVGAPATLGRFAPTSWE
jgi:hypothetical protein